MNPNKTKGDRGEREAVRTLVQMAGSDALLDARRKLGAGRRDDMGDLDVLPGVCIQVRCLADVTVALRTAASDAFVQAGRSGALFALGMVPIPRARKSAVRWLASACEWPALIPDDEIRVVGVTSAAIRHARSETLGVPRRRRVAIVRRSDTPDLYVAPLEAWVEAWRGGRPCE